MLSRPLALGTLAALLLGFNLAAWSGVVPGGYLLFCVLLGAAAFALAGGCQRTGRPRPLATAIFVIAVGHWLIGSNDLLSWTPAQVGAGHVQGLCASLFCLLSPRLRLGYAPIAGRSNPALQRTPTAGSADPVGDAHPPQ